MSVEILIWFYWLCFQKGQRGPAPNESWLNYQGEEGLFDHKYSKTNVLNFGLKDSTFLW